MEGANIGSPLLTASVQYIINVVLTLPAIIYLDQWGRRPSLLFGSFFMMIFLFISGALQAVYGEPNTPETQNSMNSNITWIVLNNKPVSSAIVACSYLFVATFATTWGPSSWTYPAEIFPSKIRAKAVSLATASNWFWNCVLAFAVPPLLWNINWKMYMLFATLYVSQCLISVTTDMNLLVMPSHLSTCSSRLRKQKARHSRRWTKSSTVVSLHGDRDLQLLAWMP